MSVGDGFTLGPGFHPMPLGFMHMPRLLPTPRTPGKSGIGLYTTHTFKLLGLKFFNWLHVLVFFFELFKSLLTFVFVFCFF